MEGTRMTVQTGSSAELIAAVVAGASLAEAAKVAGMSVSTAQRRLRDPDVANQIALLRQQLAMEAVARLQSLRSKALDFLEVILEDPEVPTAVGLRASEMALRHASSSDQERRDQEHLDLINQVTRLNEIVAGINEIVAGTEAGHSTGLGVMNDEQAD